MLIAQISDLHCREVGSSVLMGMDINRNIALAVERLNALTPRPDLVIATGDLTGSGRMEQYAALDGLLAPLELPLYLWLNSRFVGIVVESLSIRFGSQRDGSRALSGLVLACR